MRINKYLSDSGTWSRREADALLEAGRVTINGEVAAIGAQVAPGDRVCVDGDAVGAARKLTKPVYIALNKPVGIECTTERTTPNNIVDFVDHPERVFPIGRLDKDSEGLILLTNDGDIVNKVLRVEHAHEKEYLVAVDRSLTGDFVAQMSAGMFLRPEGMTRPCKVRKLDARTFAIVLTQGLNRQIRRMCEALGYRVLALRRVRFLHIQLGHLAMGRWRNLTPQEVDKLLNPAPVRAQAVAPRRSSRSSAGRPTRSGGPADGRSRGPAGAPRGGAAGGRRGGR